MRTRARRSLGFAAEGVTAAVVGPALAGDARLLGAAAAAYPPLWTRLAPEERARCARAVAAALAPDA